MRSSHVKSSRTLVVLITLMILSSELCAVFGLGQGGTGRETSNANANKTPASSKRKRSPRKPPSTTRSTAPTTKPAPPTSDKPKADDAAANERTYWETIRLSTKAADFKSYLEKYPNGQFAGLARDNLTRLESARKPQLKRDSAGRIILGSISGSNPRAAKPVPKAGSIVRNQIGMELVYVPAGSFLMGSENGSPSERPVHRVTFTVNEDEAAMARLQAPTAETDFQTARRELKRARVLLDSKVLSQPEYEAARTRYNAARAKLDSLRTATGEYGFYMGKFEVTQAQWQAVMGDNPSHFKACGNCPVEQVSWNDVQEFLDKLNDANDGFRYRLPTEAEWEYACRAGTTEDHAGDVKGMAWFLENSRNRTHAVGGKQPNAFGLYDMHGNVHEWCGDAYHGSYEGAPVDGSAWLSGGEDNYRVLRGGAFNSESTFLRSAARGKGPTNRDYSFGLRIVAVVRNQ